MIEVLFSEKRIGRVPTQVNENKKPVRSRVQKLLDNEQVRSCHRQQLPHSSFNDEIPCANSLARPAFMACTCSWGCPCQRVTSPTTLNGCVER